MTGQSTVPDWIKPGTPVVTYTYGGTSARFTGIVETTIERVAQKSFTVAGHTPERYRISDQSRPGPNEYSGRRHCVPADSDKGRAVLRALRAAGAKYRVHAAYDSWRRDGTAKRLADLAAAVAGLASLADTPEGG